MVSDEVSVDCSSLSPSFSNPISPSHQYFSLDDSRAGGASVLFTIMGWLSLPQKASSSRKRLNLFYNIQKSSPTTSESEVLQWCHSDSWNWKLKAGLVTFVYCFWTKALCSIRILLQIRYSGKWKSLGPLFWPLQHPWAMHYSCVANCGHVTAHWSNATSLQASLLHMFFSDKLFLLLKSSWIEKCFHIPKEPQSEVGKIKVSRNMKNVCFCLFVCFL